MSYRRKIGYVLFLTLLAVLAWSPSGSISQQNATLAQTSLTAGRNVNMVSGTTLPGGDPWLQRQNEPSIAVSTRNPMHLLAGANDYRTVDMPGSEGELPGNAANSPIAAGDAWLGVFQSMDRGESWTSTMLPGYPQGGSGSPLYPKYKAAADPVVRAGTNGIFYYAGIAFERLSATQNGDSALFLARYIDNNNTDGTPPIKYVDTRIIDSVTVASGQFIDKPWIAVDIPNAANQTVPISNLPGGVPAQTIAANNVYIAYTVFSGSAAANTLKGKILFRSSEDNGVIWSSAVEISSGSDINQGAVIGIDPGSPKMLYVAWRRFKKGTQTDAIMLATSNDGGKNFQKAVQIASITPFDQGSSGATFRSNSYPAMTVDDKGYIHVAWTARGFGPSNDSRIVISSSKNGDSWSTPRAIDNHSGRGHQFMPSLVYTGGKLMMAWYDARNDVSGAFTDYMDESTSGTLRHTIDVRTTTASPGSSPSFGASIQVSRYLFALVDDTKTGTSREIYQVQFNPVNYPLFKGGTQPFHGDYVDLAPSPMFVLKNKKWQYNTDASNSPIYHVAWTDNRDVRPPDNNVWTNYSPPRSSQSGEFPSPAFGACDPVTAGMRNQNIYTASITDGITIGTPRNAKPLGGLGTYSKGQIPRTFIVFVKNATSEIKSFRFSISNQPTGGTASFLEFKSLTSLDVSVAPYSEVARSVFVTSTTQNASVTVQVTEIFYPGGNAVTGGFSGSVVLNPDDSNPTIPSGDSLATTEYFNPNIINPNIINYDPANPNIINWNYANPNIINPNIINPNIINPNIINPNIINPSIINPNIINPNIINPNIINPNIINPNIINPNIINPNIINPNISNPNLINAADLVWEVENLGNTYSTYTVRTLTSATIPAGIDTHLFIYRIHYTPQSGGEDCRLKQEPHFELVASIPNPNIINPNIINPNIINPNIINPDIENATFYIGPGESAIVDLRVIDPNPSQAKIMGAGQAFTLTNFLKTVDFAATSHNVDTVQVAAEQTAPSFAATELTIGTQSQLPDAKVGTLYSLTLSASGPGGSSASYSWKLNSGDLPAGLSLSSGGLISGTPILVPSVPYPFTYHFVLEVTDGTLKDEEEFFLTIYNTPTPPPLSISTISPLPNAIVGSFYGQNLIAAGGTSPRSWSIVSGSLPAGLTFDTAGAISGIPTTTGTYSFTLQVADSSAPQQTASKAFILTVIQNQGSVTISGTCYGVLGTGLPGVLMHGLPDEPMTDANGHYSASVPSGWSGVVMPFIVGCTFTPVSLPYNSITTNQTGNYNAVAGAPAKLAFGVQPSNTAVNGTITPAVTVEIQDTAGNKITTATNTVTLSIGTNPGGGTLSGTLSKAAISGVASFDDLNINNIGQGYILRASSGSLTAATSNPFNIFSGSVGYAISGTVTLGGLPLQGVLMAGLPGNPRTDTNGFYTAAVPAGWSGTVTPTLPGFSFDPPNRSYSNVTSDQTNQGYTSNYMGGQDDVFEPNNDYDHAATITPGTYSDLVLKDEDWYKIYVSAGDAGKILKVHVKGTSYPDPSIRKDMDFYILDGSKRLLSYNYSGSDDETAYIPDLAAGWYYIGHNYISQEGTVYSMTVEIGTDFGIGFISGRVTDDLGNGIENINIELYRNPNDWNVSFPMITTGPGGYYKIGYTPGNYLVRFNLYNFYHRDPWALDLNYIGKQHPGMVQIVAGSTVAGIDTQLIPGGAISGRITDPAGNPITNATNANIQVYASDTTRVAIGYSDQNGNYVADRIPRSGNYKVRFTPPGNINYALKWYGTSYSFEEGLPVPVQTGATTSGINGQFEAGGSIVGHVTDGSGNPIQGVQIIAYDVSGIQMYTSSTNSSGNYGMSRLPGGPLKIFFNAATAVGNYVSEYYPDKLTIGEADPVPVQPGQMTSGIDAQLAAGGAITGHVIDSQENALPSVSVTCFDTNSERFYGATGDASGNYAVRLLPPGTYKVRFRATTGDYAPKWYNAKNSFALGDVVTVNAGAPVTGINGQLTDSGGSISGRVTDGTLGIAGVSVTVRDSTKQTDIAAIAALTDGTYTISRIPAGGVKVYFNTDPPYINYVSEYYNDRSTFANAYSVPVTLGQTTSGIDSVLAPRPALAITTASLPNGELALPYNTSLQASGGREFYYWSVISGGLPNGLTLSGKGVISGTPTILGTFAFEVRVTDSTSPQQTKTRNCSLTIGNYTGSGYLISGRILFNGSPLPGVAIGGLPGPPTTNAYGEYIVPVSPGWSGAASPTLGGYSFAPSNRNYSGVLSNQLDQDYSAYVLTLNIKTDWLLNGTQGHFYNQILEAERGTAPYIWSVVSGSLPDGLTLNPNGMISGTPERSALYEFVVRATDSSSPAPQRVEKTLSIYVHGGGIVSDAQILYWKLNEGTGTTALDSSGRGIRGTLSGNISYTNDAVEGFAAETPGAGWLTAETSGREFRFADWATIAAYVKIPDLTQNRFVWKLQYNHPVRDWPYTIEISLDINNTMLRLNSVNRLKEGNSNSSQYETSVNLADPANGFIPGQYNQITVTIQRDSYSIYINGVSRAAAPGALFDVNDDVQCFWAMGANWSTYWLNGKMDELSVFNKVLGPSDVLLYYQAGPYFLISGTVLFGGSGVSGVRIGGLPGNPVTTGNGQYVAPVPPGWNGTVTPALTGYAFNPPTRTYQNVRSVITGEDYAAYRSGSLQINTGTIPAGRRNAYYTTTLQAANGVMPYSWSLMTGWLPAGLTLSPGGQISGTPTEAGDFSFTVRVTDSNSQPQYATRNYTLLINPNHLGYWTSTYPFGGRINPLGLVLDPSDSNVVYAAANLRGLYKTSDGGVSWSSVTDNLSVPFDRTDMRIFLARNQVEFYVAGHTGIYKTLDQAVTWSRIDSGFSAEVRAMALHPTDGNTLYAGTRDGHIYKTANGGLSWTDLGAGIPADEIRFIAINPAVTSTVYAGTLQHGLYGSLNGGNWAPINGFQRAEHLAFDPNSTAIYLAAASSTESGLFKSTDGGATWTKLLNINLSWQPGYFIAVDPVNSTNVYVISENSIKKSADSGSTWTAYSVSSSSRLTSVIINPSAHEILYAATESEGIFKSVDGGSNWSQINNGIRAMNFPHAESHSLHIDASNPKYIYAGSINGGYRSTDRGQTWEKMGHPQGQISAIVSHSGRPGEVFTLNNQFLKSINSGAPGSWVDPSGGTFSSSGGGDLQMAPDNPDVLYAGIKASGSLAHGVYKSTNGGGTWTRKSEGLPDQAIDTLTVHPTNSNIVFVTTQAEQTPDPAIDTRLFKTSDGGLTWQHITSGLPDFLSIDQIAIYPGNPNIMYMVGEVQNGGVYKSTDGGSSWFKILDENANAVAVHPTDPDIVFLGTWNSSGFSISLNGGQTWTRFNGGLPWSLGIESMALDPANPFHVFIGSTAGVYEATFSFDLTITTGSLPPAIIQESYSATLEAMGGTAPYTWNIVSGSLPSGLDLNHDTGQIAGVTATPGTFPFMVRVSDKTGLVYIKAMSMTAFNTYTLAVQANPPAGGTVSKSPDAPKYIDGNIVDVAVSSTNSGYTFTGWSGDATGNVPLVHVRMTRNKIITANFALTASLPDYHIADLTLPGTAAAGGTIGGSVSVTVGNQGASHLYSGSISVGIYLSSDPVITTGDILLWKGRSSISALSGGGTTNVPIDPGLQIPTTIAAGDYYLGVLVDESDVIPEQDESNNAAARPISISSPGYGHLEMLGGWPYGASYGLETDEARHIALRGHGGLLQILNISNPSNPVVISELSIAPSPPNVIKISGNLVYMACGGAGLKVLDISDLLHPRIIGSCNTIKLARALDISGNFAYVTDYYQGLRVIDISNPAAPIEVGFLPFTSRTRLIEVSGNYAYIQRAQYLTDTTGEAGLSVVDISNPAHPVERSLLNLNINDLAFDSTGRFLLLGMVNNYLRIYDVDNPVAPVEVASYGGARNPVGVAVVGNRAYVADQYQQRLVVLDITDPRSPTEVSAYQFQDPVSLGKPAVAGNICLVPSWYDSLRVLDFSNLNSPVQAASCETAGLLYYADIVNGYAYVAINRQSSNRLKILNMTDLSNITETASLVRSHAIRDLAVAGNHVYLAALGNGLRTIDVSNPSNPTEVGVNMASPQAQDIVISGRYAYVADGSNGLRIFDISTPSSPVLVSSCLTPGTALQVSVSGKYAYLACDQRGLRIIDISDPWNPWEIGSYEFSGRAYNVNVSGNRAYVNDNEHILRIVDVSDPRNPVQLSSLNFYWFYGDIGISGNYIFVPDTFYGVRVINVSNPASPVEVDAYFPLSSAHEIFICENRIYVVNRDTGFYVIEFHLPGM